MTQAKVKHLLCSNLILHAGGRWRMAGFCAVQEQLYARFDQIVDLGGQGHEAAAGIPGRHADAAHARAAVSIACYTLASA